MRMRPPDNRRRSRENGPLLKPHWEGLAMDKDDDRRSSKRRRTVLKGRVVFNNRASVLDCTVRDLSDTGAQITLADVSTLPLDFELDIPSKGVLVLARVMWSRGKNHGIRIVQAAD
jgi:hypothetical protein